MSWSVTSLCTGNARWRWRPYFVYVSMWAKHTTYGTNKIQIIAQWNYSMIHLTLNDQCCWPFWISYVHATCRKCVKLLDIIKPHVQMSWICGMISTNNTTWHSINTECRIYIGPNGGHNYHKPVALFTKKLSSLFSYWPSCSGHCVFWLELYVKSSSDWSVLIYLTEIQKC